MVAVANLVDVTVRAKASRDEIEWVTVEPDGLHSTGGMVGITE